MDHRVLRNRNVVLEKRVEPYGRRVPTGNPRGQPRKTYEEKTSRNSRMDDIREPYNVLQSVPFDQAKEAFLMLLRNNGMAAEAFVMKKILNGSWDAKEVTNHMKQNVSPPKKFQMAIEMANVSSELIFPKRP